MKTIGKITKTVVAVAITGALVVPATAAFAGEKTDRAVVGALIGGVAGAALGHGKGDAIAIGAVAGAALGATTAKSKYDDRRYGYEHRYAPRYDNAQYGASRYAYDNNRYAHDRYGHRYDRYDVRYDRYGNAYRR